MPEATEVYEPPVSFVERTEASAYFELTAYVTAGHVDGGMSVYSGLFDTCYVTGYVSYRFCCKFSGSLWSDSVVSGSSMPCMFREMCRFVSGSVW